jgi:hypothetical protein
MRRYRPQLRGEVERDGRPDQRQGVTIDLCECGAAQQYPLRPVLGPGEAPQVLQVVLEAIPSLCLRLALGPTQQGLDPRRELTMCCRCPAEFIWCLNGRQFCRGIDADDSTAPWFPRLLQGSLDPEFATPLYEIPSAEHMGFFIFGSGLHDQVGEGHVGGGPEKMVTLGVKDAA